MVHELLEGHVEEICNLPVRLQREKLGLQVLRFIFEDGTHRKPQARNGRQMRNSNLCDGHRSSIDPIIVMGQGTTQLKRTLRYFALDQQQKAIAILAPEQES